MKQLKIRKDIKKTEPNQPMSLKMKTNLKAGQGFPGPSPQEPVSMATGIIPIPIVDL